jgi:hypothetical protein
MAFTGSFFCTSAKKELAMAQHNFSASGGHAFKIALYDNTAALNAATTAYPGAGVGGELAAAGGYTQGGQALAANIDPATTGTTAFWSWTANPQWVTATFTTYGALIYNFTNANKSVAVLDFGGAKPVSSGTFTIVLPTNDASNAILRIA